MKRSKALFFNTLLLTAVSFLMRYVGVSFQVFLSNKIGADGIGLFQLTMSVSMLSLTIANSGIRLATTRLVSEELGSGNHSGIKSAVRRCLLYAVSFGTLAALLLYFGAEFIGNVWVGDSRTILSLRLLSLSLPFVAMSSVMGGYFTAVQRVIKSSAVSAVEQFVRIGVVVYALSLLKPDNLEYSCAIVVVGGVAAEMVSFLLIFITYLLDKRRYKAKTQASGDLTKRMFKIALPLAFSSYARTALSTLEHLLVPRGLKKSGISSSNAIAAYGTIHGMVFPILLLPSALFSSMSELLIPELTEAQIRDDTLRIELIVNHILRLCLMISIGITGIMFFYSRELGGAIYSSKEAGYYMMVFSPLLVVMHLDSITDGMLKGLGQQIHSMRYNILDSLISAVMVYVLLPKYAITAYIFIIYFTESFNFTLSLRRLAIVVNLRFSLGAALKSLLSIVCAIIIAVFALRMAGFPLAATPASVAAHIILSLLLYLGMLYLFSCITKEDIRRFVSAVK